MSALDPLLARLKGSSDLALAALALALVSLLVAPLPPWLLDLCIAANLALAATVLVVALFARDALRFASFPTLLLLTTLFRLALEVSSTRLVLSRGEAGRVIQAFGQVVVAGNYVVGAVVFAILTLVQLLVVAKGAERVAEVAARFTLDALPGKQMSIDADLRCGAVDQAEARRRRRALEREGQLYGAMDGALKFVNGDAIAGVAIVLVNVAGGLVAGLARGLPLEMAARRYALLAIGDGLVAQIPALLISVAAGVAVTRVAAEEEGGSLSEDLGRQLFSDPRALAAVAALCGTLAVVPGLPAAPFLALAVAAGAGGHLLARRARAVKATAAPEVDPAGAEGAPRTEPPLGQPVPLALELAPDLAAAGAERLERELLPALRREIARELGVHVPEIAVRSAPLPAGAWRLLVDEVPAASGRAPEGEAVALAPPGDLDAVGIAAVAEVDPLTFARVARIAAADAARASALAPVRGPLERVGVGVAAALRAHAHLLVGVQELQALLDGLEPSHPALVREATRQIPAPVLAEVLRQLLEEGISVRPLRSILEALLEAGGGARGSVALVESCRRALRRHIAHGHAGAGALDALLLDPAAEAVLREALAGSVAAVDPVAARSLLDDIERKLEARDDLRPPVLLAGPDVRRALRQLVAPRFPQLAVLSYEELPASLPVHPVGSVAVAEA
ncbi:MAG TPA: flagellar biosynthesis protein FlhA [Anaeromyxobacteraceae bacterium]